MAKKFTIFLSTNDDVFLPKTSVEREEILESLPKTKKRKFLTRHLISLTSFLLKFKIKFIVYVKNYKDLKMISDCLLNKCTQVTDSFFESHFVQKCLTTSAGKVALCAIVAFTFISGIVLSCAGTLLAGVAMETFAPVAVGYLVGVIACVALGIIGCIGCLATGSDACLLPVLVGIDCFAAVNLPILPGICLVRMSMDFAQKLLNRHGIPVAQASY